MAGEKAIVKWSPRDIDPLIRLIRGQRVMIDEDLAKFYGIRTKALNQAVARNRARFPADFAFSLTAEEFTNLRSQFVTSSSEYGGRRYRPAYSPSKASPCSQVS